MLKIKLFHGKLVIFYIKDTLVNILLSCKNIVYGTCLLDKNYTLYKKDEKLHAQIAR